MVRLPHSPAKLAAAGVIAVVTTGRSCYRREHGAVSQRKQSETSMAGIWCRQEEAVP
jgi:hypothetical protein